MKMSVFRQGRPRKELDHLVLIEQTVDDDGPQMIIHAANRNATVLVGLESGEVIIKPMTTGDEHLSFEGLYDTCISMSEFRRMEELKVSSPADFPPSIFEVTVIIEPNFAPRAKVRVKAKHEHEVGAKLSELIASNPSFLLQLTQVWVTWMITETGSAEVSHTGALKCIPNATDAMREWQVLPYHRRGTKTDDEDPKAD